MTAGTGARDFVFIPGEMPETHTCREPRPKGRPEGSPILDFVVEDHADHQMGSFKSQHEAITWAREHGHHPLIARVRHLNDP